MLQELTKKEYAVIEWDGAAKPKSHNTTGRYSYNDGWVFEYTNAKMLKDLVLVPRNYQFGELNGKLLIGKNMGNSSAAHFVDGTCLLIGKSSDPDAPGEDLAVLARTHVATRGYKVLYDKTMPWKWLIIGIAALVLVVGVVWFIKTQQAG